MWVVHGKLTDTGTGMDNERTSKYISMILRHRPEAIGIRLDGHGWAKTDELIAGVSRTHPLDMETLEEIVRTDEKQRYSFNEDHTLIRANQGHSVNVDVELKSAVPPRYLYHGTGEKSAESIERDGIIPRARLYVHLSADYDTAVKVGERHGKPVVFRVLAGKMAEDCYEFLLSVNGVWLTKYVAPEYLERC